MDLSIREANEADADWIVPLNAANTPAVGEMNTARFSVLEAEAHAVLIAENDDGEALGFMIVMAPGRDYDSPNYRWFEAELESFLYVDRIAVAEEARGKGVGLALYAEALDMAEAHGAGQLAAEVNLKPENPASLAFHRKLGFAALGEQDLPDGKRVVMLARPTLNPEVVPA